VLPNLPLTADEPAIRVRGLVNEIGGQLLHDQIDFEVRYGEVLAVVGSSGSGKSVLMRTIIGLQRPKSGIIEVFGRNIETLRESEKHEMRKSYGVLFQEGALFSSLTVCQNIEVPLREMIRLPESLLDWIASLRVATVGLPPDAGFKYPAELSGGMKKRASLARALALDPPLLFLDEPTAGLDPIAASGIDSLIRKLQRKLHLTTFMVTHDMATLRMVADRVAVLVDRKLRIGTIESFRSDPHPWISAYFNGPRARSIFSV
jgi:phospholipid/cholesterol/gamma-HCH transport system ATP-binding protein